MNRFLARLVLCVVAATVASSSPVGAQADADRAAIIVAVQSLFDAMAARSVEGAARVTVPDGQVIAVRDEKGTGTPRARSLKEFATGLAAGKTAMLERMWSPDVEVHGTIATLATRYDFHQDGTFTHCGTDLFTLVKTPEGWKIAGLTYTVERTGCAPSPLGAPKEQS